MISYPSYVSIRYDIHADCNPFDERIQRLLSGPLVFGTVESLGHPVFCLRSHAASNFK